MNTIEALALIDSYSARKHVLRALDETKCVATHTARYLHTTVPTLRAWIGQLSLWDDVDHLIAARRFPLKGAIKRPLGMQRTKKKGRKVTR